METVSVIERNETLDKPGAGIPWYEESLIRYVVLPVLPFIFNWETSLSFLQKQIHEIHALVKDLDEETMQKQVLIPRLFALEDSSRFWSINMVIEHLVTVNLGTYEIVEKLTQEEQVQRQLGTAKVKPLHNTNHTKDLLVFEKAYTKMIAKVTNRASITTKEHPWFGPLNNYNWHAFIGFHNKLHKNQIKQILKIIHNERLPHLD